MKQTLSSKNHPEALHNLADIREQYITFRVEKQEYAINITSVREIKGWVHTTPLPNSPKYMRGVVNLRGTVVPILDLRSRFGMGHTDVTANHVVMIINLESRVVGVLVDAVCDILTIDSNELRSVPEVDHEEGINIVRGLIQKDSKMVALLMLDKLFDSSVDMLQQPNFSEDMIQNMPSFDTQSNAARQ
jgi:purine-binding chemotaxis protein CheW